MYCDVLFQETHIAAYMLFDVPIYDHWNAYSEYSWNNSDESYKEHINPEWSDSIADTFLEEYTAEYYIEEVIDIIDGVLVMCVNPGFAGQTMMPNIPNKLKRCPRTEYKNRRNEYTNYFKTNDRGRGLYTRSTYVTNPTERVQRKTVANRLSNTSSEVKRPVNRAFRSLPRRIFVVVDCLADKPPLHLNGHHRHARCDP